MSKKSARKDDRLQRGRPGFGLVVTAGNVDVEQADQVEVVFHADTGYAEADRPAILWIDRQQPALDQGGTKPDRRDFTAFELLAKLPVGQGFHRDLEPQGHGHSQSQSQKQPTAHQETKNQPLPVTSRLGGWVLQGAHSINHIRGPRSQSGCGLHLQPEPEALVFCLCGRVGPRCSGLGQRSAQLNVS